MYVDEDAIITDGTACVGGNTSSFAKVFQNVNAIEIDPSRFSYLKNNMSVLGLDHVSCQCGDVYDICQTSYQDVLFLDPPWGGPEYKQNQNIKLYLSNRELSEVCIDLSLYCKYIALKVPMNFKPDIFDHSVKNVLERVHYNTYLRKMHLIIYQCLNHPIVQELQTLL
jgi:predicted RNA methylase